MFIELTQPDGYKVSIDSDCITAFGAFDIDGKLLTFIECESMEIAVTEDYITVKELINGN